ncbi:MULTISPECIES: hypothetical protein [Flavobacterium]|uniref:Lipoprotein n=1 Tax=Flavobacterium hankyongi TaxID=1176532 RepID=A0ABP8ZUJ8_9FLAO|nr:hypothetical protein [Flavobacterium sp. N1846]
MKIKILILSALLSVVFYSCTKDNETENKVMTAEDAKVNARLDVAGSDISAIVEEQSMTSTEDGMTSKGTQQTTFAPTCATITRVPAYGTVITPGTTITKTIDFDPINGCTLPNGNVLKGKIIVTFVYQPSATSHTINYQFDNFYHNGVKIVGNKTFTISWGTSTTNPNTHAIVVMNMDFTATFPSGNVYHRTGSRTTEITGGQSTPEYTDNVYSVTGQWTTNSTTSGWSMTSTITSPLIVKLNCSNIVKGIVQFQGYGTSTLDFGNGDCDNVAIFTHNGVQYTIILN